MPKHNYTMDEVSRLHAGEDTDNLHVYMVTDDLAQLIVTFPIKEPDIHSGIWLLAFGIIQMGELLESQGVIDMHEYLLRWDTAIEFLIARKPYERSPDQRD